MMANAESNLHIFRCIMHLVIFCQVQKTHSGPVIGMVSKVSGLWHGQTNDQLNVELIAI